MTLRDAANYIQKLPKAEQDLDEWQAAVEALLLVVELNGPTMMARIGMMRALISRDNLDENGASIWVRRGGERKDN